VKDFFLKRIISEILNTQLQSDGFNYQTDAEYIQTTHIHINFKQILNTNFNFNKNLFIFMLFLYTVFIILLF